jgi:hypothetical protein
MDEDDENIRRIEKDLFVIEGNLYSMKNSKEIGINRSTGKRFVRSNDNVLKQKEDLKIQLADAVKKKKWKVMTKGLELPYYMVVQLHRATLQKFDYTNITQILFDAFRDACYIPDDDASCLVPIFLPYQLSRTYPRTIIHIIREPDIYLSVLHHLTKGE